MKKHLITTIILLISSTTLFAQDKYELSPLLNGVGMNTVFSKIVDYTTRSKKEGETTLTYHRIKNGQLTFLGNDVTDTVVSKKNNMVEFIGFILEKEEYDKPYYTVYPYIGCSGEIYVNDVLVFSSFGEETMESGDVSAPVPINQVVLQSGKFEVVGKMYPRLGKETLTEEEYMFLDFFINEADPDKWKKSRIKIHPRVEQPWDGLSENINYPVFEIKTELEVELPFILDGWQNSIDLSKLKEKDLLVDVIRYYRQIHSVMASHNVSKFLELSKEKMKLQEEAFYFTEERKRSFREAAAQLFNQKLEILPLNVTDLKLQIMGYGKLVRLVRLDGSAALQYKSPDVEKQSNVEIDIKLHMRSEEKGLTII